MNTPQGNSSSGEHGLSLAGLRSAGPTVGMSAANSALGISRAHGYSLAREGKYPVRVLKLGKSYRVVTAELIALLEPAKLAA